uniref:Uncharacterized protein n=1 Tax=Anguilla anguilla TaxID=7936 RepID=A0A0E9WQU0_ANGAN
MCKEYQKLDGRTKIVAQQKAGSLHTVVQVSTSFSKERHAPDLKDYLKIEGIRWLCVVIPQAGKSSRLPTYPDRSTSTENTGLLTLQH